jgi:nucleoside-triphosphatase THEP1
MEKITIKPLKPVWLKASVVGGTWASIEIILGSFLHNLKIPISGAILSFISVWLLISFLQIWKENGLILRAGIICALLKSISPSAIILGPMIGIFSEALLIEFFILVFGKNLIGYLFGGAFAVLSTLLHKVVSLLILYGFNLVKILSDLYTFAVKQIKLEHLSPVYLLIIITAIYIITGMAGAVAGYIAGYRYIKKKDQTSLQDEVTLHPGKKPIIESSGQKYSVIFIFIHLVSIVVTLLLINSTYIIPAIIVTCTYLFFCIFQYKNSLKRLKKISFWISFLIITFAAAFLWNGFSQGAFFSLNGLIIGLKMNARAIIIIIGFAAMSVELKNPVIRSLMYSRGLANLYQSTDLAFSALPFFIANISKSENKKNTVSKISSKSLFSLAEILLSAIQKEQLNKPGIVIITGEIHQGKTTLAREVVSILLERNIRIAGFLSFAVIDDGIRTGYNLFDIETKELTELCSTTGHDNRLNVGQYYFNNKALTKGLKLLSADNLIGKQCIVIDEIGPLELSNKGWSSAIEIICQTTSLPQLWVVRRNIVKKVLKRWITGDVYIYNLDSANATDITNKVIELIAAMNPETIQNKSGNNSLKPIS